MLLRRKERYENLLHQFFRNTGAIILYCKYCPVIFCFPYLDFNRCIFPSPQSLNCTFYNIDQHLSQQIGIGIQLQIFRNSGHIDLHRIEIIFGTTQNHNPLYEFTDIEQLPAGCRYSRKFPVRLDKRNQTFTGFADDMQPVHRCRTDSVGIHALIFVQIQQGIAQRSNRCYGVHNFMGKHTNQLDPGLDFFFIHFIINIVYDDQSLCLIIDRNSSYLNTQLYRSSLHRQRKSLVIPRFQGIEKRGHCRVNPVQLTRMGKHIQSQQFQCRNIGLQNKPLRIQNYNTRMYTAQNHLIKFFFLLSLYPGFLNDMLHLVQNIIQKHFRTGSFLLPKIHRIVVIFHRLEKICQFTVHCIIKRQCFRNIIYHDQCRYNSPSVVSSDKKNTCRYGTGNNNQQEKQQMQGYSSKHSYLIKFRTAGITNRISSFYYTRSAGLSPTELQQPTNFRYYDPEPA